MLLGCVMKKTKKKKAIKTELIVKFMRENNLSKTAFCKYCKISKTSFNKIMLSILTFEPYCLYNISVILDIHVYDMFNKS